MDTFVGYILLYGVACSLLLICLSLVWQRLNTGHLWFPHELSGMNLFQLLAWEISQALHGRIHPRTLLGLGIAVLMLTPFLRVFASVVYFLVVLRNWKYSLFTAFVLTVLTYSLFLR
jgi:uncharacterized membrane protein